MCNYFVNNLCFFIIVIISPMLVDCGEKHITVNTTHGRVSGKVLESLIYRKKYYGFMGIPYAVPPIKDLRFLPPQPLGPWDGVLKATKEKQACIQFNNNIKKGQPIGHYGVEDCLYLDIFTPAIDGNERAVIVFLYNEHFSYSYNKTKEYSPDFFIEEDVVVVTISHRLSIFGFLSLEDEVLPGNSGLKDIVVGLEWLRNNLNRFGGDPDKITLMGSQGGAVAVDLLIHSKANNLFKSAILQSGTSWSSRYLQNNGRDRAFRLAKSLEYNPSNSNQLLKDLNEIHFGDLLKKEMDAIPKDYFKEHQRSLLAFGPVVEKNHKGLIIEYPENLSRKANIPIMIGFNSREGLEPALQYLIEPKYLSFVEKDFPLLLPMRVNFKFDPTDKSYQAAVHEIKKVYFSEGKVKIGNVADYVTYLGDVLVAYAMDYAVEFYSKLSKNSVYYYYFDYYSDLNENKNNLLQLSTVTDGTWGAATGDELCYLFKCPDLKHHYLKFNQTLSHEISIQRKIVKMWTNFAKYGNPTPDHDSSLNDLEWPSYNVDRKRYLHIDKKLIIKQDLYKKRFQFWDQFLTKWEQKAIDGIISENKYECDEL